MSPPAPLIRRRRLTLLPGVTDIDTGIESVEPDDVMVQPLMPVAPWLDGFIAHGEPTYSSVTGTVHVEFTNYDAGAQEINVMFWKPHSIMTPASTEAYGPMPPPTPVAEIVMIAAGNTGSGSNANLAFRYDVDGDAWTAAAVMPDDRADGIWVKPENADAFFHVGRSDTPSIVVPLTGWSYDADADTWNAIADFPGYTAGGATPGTNGIQAAGIVHVPGAEHPSGTDRIYLYSGSYAGVASPSSAIDQIWEVDPSNAYAWTQLASVGNGNNGVVTAMIAFTPVGPGGDPVLVAFGGIYDTPAFGSCDGSGGDQTFVYDILTNAWSLGAVIAGFAGAVCGYRLPPSVVTLADGRLLAIGGQGTTAGSVLSTLTDALIYDAAADSWLATDPLAQSRYDHVSVLLDDGDVLTMGGWNGATYRSTCERYNPTTGTWSAAAAMSVARRKMFVAKLSDGRVLCAGGIGSGGVAVTNVEIYDPDLNTWTPVSPMPTAMSHNGYGQDLGTVIL